jgi:hypothetical protein
MRAQPIAFGFRTSRMYRVFQGVGRFDCEGDLLRDCADRPHENILDLDDRADRGAAGSIWWPVH